MTTRLANERGSAMFVALGVLAVLALLAVVVMAIVISEKRIAFTDYSTTRSFYSADAASEAGVSWIRNQFVPPAIVDTSSHVLVANGFTTLSNDHLYKFDVTYVGKRIRPGWSVEYKDYEYRVQATGSSSQSAESAIELGATRLYREGY